MTTLYDFSMELVNMRKALDTIEVVGPKNASLLVYVYDKCNKLIDTINDVANELSKDAKKKKEEADEETNQNDRKEEEIDATSY